MTPYFGSSYACFLLYCEYMKVLQFLFTVISFQLIKYGFYNFIRFVIKDL